MVNRRVTAVILVSFAALLAVVMWWPQSTDGWIVDAQSGDPISSARVAATAVLYKPLAPVLALSWGDITSTVSSVVTTDGQGRFTASFFAGIRLKRVMLYMTKPGYVVAPGIDGGSGSADVRRHDLDLEPVFPAWAVSSGAPLETGGALGIVGDSQQLVEFGRNHAFSIRRDTMTIDSDDTVSVAVTIRPLAATIQETASFALVAPEAGYQREWHATLDCTLQTLAQRFFSVRTDDDRYGAVALELQTLCFDSDRIPIEYRFGKTPGIRSLATEEELNTASAQY